MTEKAYYLLLLSCLLSFLQRADIAPPRTHSYRVKPQDKPFSLDAPLLGTIPQGVQPLLHPASPAAMSGKPMYCDRKERATPVGICGC